MKHIVNLTLLLLLWHTDSRAQLPAPAKKPVVWEYTYLKSLPGQHERLVRFIRQNWFAMDSIAIRQELMTHYQLLDAGADAAGEWNLVVAVGYPQKKGYAAIQEAFETIRRGHIKQLVDGLDLPRLGRIIRSQTYADRTSAY